MAHKTDSGSRPIATRMVIRFAFTAVLTLAVLFVAAGTLKWWVAWAYVAVTLAVLGVSRVLMIRKNPDLAIERAQAGAQGDTKSWDRVLVPVVAIYGLSCRDQRRPALGREIVVVLAGWFPIPSLRGLWLLG